MIVKDDFASEQLAQQQETTTDSNFIIKTTSRETVNYYTGLVYSHPEKLWSGRCTHQTHLYS